MYTARELQPSRLAAIRVIVFSCLLDTTEGHWRWRHGWRCRIPFADAADRVEIVVQEPSCLHDRVPGGGDAPRRPTGALALPRRFPGGREGGEGAMAAVDASQSRERVLALYLRDRLLRAAPEDRLLRLRLLLHASFLCHDAALLRVHVRHVLEHLDEAAKVLRREDAQLLLPCQA